MTVQFFFMNYIPWWLYDDFVNEAKKQKAWNPEDVAYRGMIDMKLSWKRTSQGREFWEKVHGIIMKDFDTPELLLEKLNALRAKLSPSQPPPKEESLENKTEKTDKMKLDKYANQTVATVTLVEGVDISDLSPTSIIAQIKAHKRAVKDLEEAGISGAYLNCEAAKHNLAVTTLQAELNSRVSTCAAAPAPAEA